MSRPLPPGRGRTPLPKAKLDAFFHQLAQTGSVSLAAARSQIRRSRLYEMRQDDPAFAERWTNALHLGVERLQDTAMSRALHGMPKPVWRNGQKVGSVQQFDNRLLQFLLKAHRPDLYGDRPGAAAPGLPFDLVKRMAAAEARMEALGAQRAGQAKPAAPARENAGTASTSRKKEKKNAQG